MIHDAETYYQALADFQRRRHTRGGYGWPGKPLHSSANTRYPNILAELDSSGLWLKTMAEFAGVSPEIMAAVIEDREELTFKELLNLAVRWGCGTIGYLSAPVLQIIDPSTNKGKCRRRELNDLMKKTEDLPDSIKGVHGIHIYWKVYAAPVHEKLNRGIPVTYANWWWACHRVQEALEAVKPQSFRIQRRTTA